MRQTSLSAIARLSLGLALFAAHGCDGGGSGGATGPQVARMQFVSVPAEIAAGSPFTLSVELVDADGVRVPSATAAVTITAANVTIGGATTVDAVSGLATFSGLTMTQVGNNRRFVATTRGHQVTSSPFLLRAGALSLNHSSMSPAGGTFETFPAVPFTFTLRDAYGNLIAGRPVTLRSSVAAVMFTPAIGVTTPIGTFATSVKSFADGVGNFIVTDDSSSISFPTPVVHVDNCVPTPMPVPSVFTGSVTYASGCEIHGLPGAELSFAIGAQTGVMFSFTGGEIPTMLEINTIPPRVVFRFHAWSGVVYEWLLPAGDFQARVGSLTGVGTFVLTSVLATRDMECDTRFMVIDGVYTGQTLTAGDCVLASDGTLYDEFVLMSPLPCTITMRSYAIDAFLVLADPIEGVLLSTDDDGGGGTDARFTLPICTNPTGGPLLVVANTWGTQAGPYSLQVEYGTGGVQAGAALRSASVQPAPKLMVPAELRRALDASVRLSKGLRKPARR